MRTSIAGLVAFAFAFAAQAKRAAPPVVEPIQKGGFEYSVLVEPQVQGCKTSGSPCGEIVYLVSKDVKSQARKWQTQLYRVEFDAAVETDVQAIPPKELRFRDAVRAEVIDEGGNHYIVSLKDGKLTQPTEPKVYGQAGGR